MEFLYTILIAFIFVFISELGDKTQLIVISYSSKLKTYNILIGIALGSFFSHGLAIFFGSSIGSLDNLYVHRILELITSSSFILSGLFSLAPKRETRNKREKNGFLHKLRNPKLNYIFMIALSIAIGEIGDKTFLASIGLGIRYPNQKLSLVLGAILGMIFSNILAIFLGKFLSKKISPERMNQFSGVLFLIFGIVGLLCLH